MNAKQRLLEWVSELPDDILVYKSESNTYDCVDIKIFLEFKDEKFLKWYFGI